MDLLLLALLPLLWVLTALPSAKAGAPDFAKGFDLLFELGLPDASGPDWRYTPLSGPSLQRQNFIDPFGSFNVRIGLGDVFEHGWVQTTRSNVVATPPGTAASTPIPEPHFPTGTKVLIDGWQLQTAVPPGAESIHLEKLGLSPANIHPGEGTADEKADAQLLVQYLQRVAKNKEEDDNSLWQGALEDRDFIATCFFRAAQHHRRGYREEAAAAVQALLTIVPRQDRLMDLAVQWLAETSYANAMNQFRGSGDWQALHASLTHALRTYTRGWERRPLVEKLHAQITQRLATPTAPPLPLAQARLLTPEQRTWWEQVADDPPVPYKEKISAPADNPTDEREATIVNIFVKARLDRIAVTWLYDFKMQVDPSNLALWRKHSATGPAWTQAILHQDWDWMTIAAAAVDDETLIPVVSSYWNVPNPNPFDFENSPPDFESQELERSWQHMYRPQTRGELAREFLLHTLPLTNEQRADLATDPVELRRLGLECGRVLKGSTPSQAARYFLKFGDLAQKGKALMALINTGAAEDLKLAEDLIIQQSSIRFDEASHLVRTRGKASRPFLQRYRRALFAAFEIEASGDSPSEDHKLPSPWALNLATLEHLAAGRGPTDILAAYVRGELAFDTLYAQTQALLTDDSHREGFVDPILDAVLRMPKGQGEIKMGLLTLCAWFGRKLTPARKDKLRQILREDPDTLVVTHDYTVSPLSQVVSWLTLQFPDDKEGVPEKIHPLFRDLDTSDIWPVWLAFGRAILDGRSLPPLPSATNVTTERRREMMEAIPQRLEKGEWSEYVQALSLDEKLALGEDLATVPFTPIGIEAALRFRRIDSYPPDLAARVGLHAFVGQSASASTLAKLGEICRTQLPELKEGEGDGLWIAVKPMPLRQGLRIFITTGSTSHSTDFGKTTFTYVGHWMKQLPQTPARSPELLGYGWMVWKIASDGYQSADWYQEKGQPWQHWPDAGHPTLGASPIGDTNVSETDLLPALEARSNTWDKPSETIWFETGARRPGGSAREVGD
ncbi:hypothetical protein [Verrucomicrobium sp. BvORR034]|uniref:hypothetical protein n=1 Tax=Verrucomicrobium sp. BvORR034 TaxID=1396418 RepID=UPI000678F6D3|nr:hypothetical protein [Verrucomicrobium sp. BvORR034]